MLVTPGSNRVVSSTRIEVVADQVRLMSDKLRSSPTHPHPVFISLPYGPELLIATLATWVSGNAIAPVSLRATVYEVEKLYGIVKPSFIIREAGDHRFDSLIPEPSPTSTEREVEITAIEQACDGTLLPGDAWIATTSGTTGQPKCAVLNADAVLANCLAVRDYLDLSPADRVLVFTPPHFTYGVVQLLSALCAGATVLAWPYGLLSPNDLARFGSDLQMTGVSANPTAFEMLLPKVPEVRSVRYVLAAGQPLRRQLVLKLRDVFCSATCLNGFGCTENTNRISFATVSDAGPFRNEIASVGRPISGTNIRIEQGTSEVVIAGTSLMRGYLADLRSLCERVHEYNTGDIGELGENGELYLVGRTKTQMNVGNEMVDPEEVETAVLRVPEISECAVGPIEDILLGDAIAALIVTDSRSADLNRKIAAVLSAVLRRSRWPHHIVIVSSGDIPRTDYGKIDRLTLKTRLINAFGLPGSLSRKATQF